MTTASGNPSADDLATVREALDKIPRGDIVVADVEDALDRLAARITELEERKTHERKLRTEAESKWEEWHDRAEAAKAREATAREALEQIAQGEYNEQNMTWNAHIWSRNIALNALNEKPEGDEAKWRSGLWRNTR